MPLSIANFSAWITVEGEEAECYAPETSEDGKTTTCWIASQAGKHFSIHWKNSTRDVATIATINLDGMDVKGGCMRSAREKPGPDYNNTVTRESVRISEDAVRPFVFSSIQLTDDESSCLSEEQAQKIGNIEIVIRRAVIGERIPSDERQYDSQESARRSGKVYERVKKACVHRISYGDQTQKQDKSPWSMIHYKEQLATLIFRYTSRDILRAKGIIPQIPALDNVEPPISPKPKQEEPDGLDGPSNTAAVPSGSTSQPRSRVKIRTVIEILSDSDDDDDQPRKRIKLEDNVKREPLHPGLPESDVIDLTL